MLQPDFKIRSQTGGTLRLTQAVLIYQGDHDCALATVHNVEDVDGQPVILAGQAMTPRAANQLSRALSKSVSHGGFLPETVLYTNGDLLVWWVPPAKRHIVFKAEELKTKWGTAERGEVVPHPGLVFATSSTIWKVWAIKGVVGQPWTRNYSRLRISTYGNTATFAVAMSRCRTELQRRRSTPGTRPSSAQSSPIRTACGNWSRIAAAPIAYGWTC